MSRRADRKATIAVVADKADVVRWKSWADQQSKRSIRITDETDRHTISREAYIYSLVILGYQ